MLKQLIHNATSQTQIIQIIHLSTATITIATVIIIFPISLLWSLAATHTTNTDWEDHITTTTVATITNQIATITNQLPATCNHHKSNHQIKIITNVTVTNKPFTKVTATNQIANTAVTNTNQMVTITIASPAETNCLRHTFAVHILAIPESLTSFTLTSPN